MLIKTNLIRMEIRELSAHKKTASKDKVKATKSELLWRIMVLITSRLASILISMTFSHRRGLIVWTQKTLSLLTTRATTVLTDTFNNKVLVQTVKWMNKLHSSSTNKIRIIWHSETTSSVLKTVNRYTIRLTAETTPTSCKSTTTTTAWSIT